MRDALTEAMEQAIRDAQVCSAEALRLAREAVATPTDTALRRLEMALHAVDVASDEVSRLTRAVIARDMAGESQQRVEHGVWG